MPAHVDELMSEEHIVHLTGEEDVHTKLLGGRLKPTGHVDIRRKVGSIDFERRSDGSFDGPAIVQSKTHFYGIVPETFVQLGVESVAWVNSKYVQIREIILKKYTQWIEAISNCKYSKLIKEIRRNK